MKLIEWDEEKNQRLQLERGLSFEGIVIALEQGKLIDIVPNPSARYAHQNVLIVEIDEYAVLVPFVEDDEKIFLKTAFKSRKIMKGYQRRSSDENETT